MANKWVTYDHSNYPPGGPVSATYLADADEFNQNYQDICDAVGARYVRGIACADKNSTASRCEIWLQADGDARDVCDVGWVALIYYSSAHVWETTVSVSGSDCYIVFGNDQLENPAASGIEDYSDVAFIDALHIMLFPKKMMLPKDWVITTSGAAGRLSTEEIYHESEPLSTFIADVKTRLDTICKEGGGLEDGVVDSSAIDGAEAVKLDGPVNLLAGGSLEHYGDQHNLLFRVEAYNGVSEDYSIVDAGAPVAGKVAEIVGQKAEAAVYGEVYVPTFDEEYFWFEVNYLSGLDIPYEELGADEETRKEGINIIKETYAEKRVNRETIIEWETGLVDLFGPEFEGRFERAVSATEADWVGYCDPDLAWALVDFHNELLARYPATFGGRAIHIVSAYRRLGTDVNPGDRYGKDDARDITGAAHWKGLAVDVSTYIPDTVFKKDLNALDDVLRRVGLERTSEEEPERNHYGLRKAK